MNRLLLLAWLLLPWTYCQAHLLNMSSITLNVAEQNKLHISYDIDPTVQLGNREAYYQISQLEQPLQQPEVKALLAELAAATVIRIDGQVANIEWQYEDFITQKLSADDYHDPLQWPKTIIKATAELNDLSEHKQLSAQFLTNFVFEEPIELTITDGERKLTRWLIALQSSPAFAMTADGANIATTKSEAMSLEDKMDFFGLGFKHILPEGYDHLLFIFLLMLVASTWLQGIGQLTVFTLAHSLTLTISLFGIVQLPTVLVESLIALSILYLAFEALFNQRKVKMRYSLIFAFGLMHGMGFAAALAEQTLPATGIALVILLFNLGIEAAQIVMALVSMLLIVTMRKLIATELVNRGFAVISVCMSLYWFISIVK